MKKTTEWSNDSDDSYDPDDSTDIILELSASNNVSIDSENPNDSEGSNDSENQYDSDNSYDSEDSNDSEENSDFVSNDSQENADFEDISDSRNEYEEDLCSENDSDSENDAESDSENDAESDSENDSDSDSENDSDSQYSSNSEDSDYENGFFSDSDYENSDTENEFNETQDSLTDDEILNNYFGHEGNIFNSSPQNENINASEVASFLRNWVNENNINHTPINPLLRFLKRVFPKLCIDVRTLMKTPKSREAIDIPPGTYVHLGIKTPLDLLLSTVNVEDMPDVILLDINIDGVPLSRSSTTGFWLILARISNISSLRKYIFVVGVYYGKKKPYSFNDFLRPFVEEINTLTESYTHRNQHVNIKIHSIICDAPAKAGVKCIKSHNGFYGCDRCEQKGVKVNHRMTFALIDEYLRDNASFRGRVNAEHHVDDTIIENIDDLDMIKDFPLDPLHVIYLGVVKRLLRIWLNGDEDSILHTSIINEISAMLDSFGKSQPKEFQRRCRGLSEIGFFKGHEFRTFLLYSGPVVLKNKLSVEKYNHFLLLHSAITILNSSELCKKLNSLAECLLKDFVTGMAELYSLWNVVYCVHSLIHIPSDVKKYGDLNKYSAFDFESYMFKIKRQIKKHNTQQAELCNRIEETYFLDFVKIPEKMSFPFFKRPKKVGRGKVFREILFDDFTLNRKNGNNWFMTSSNQIIRFEHVEIINGLWYVYGYERKNKIDFYTIPIRSSKLHIYQSLNREEPGKLYLLSEVRKKMFCMNLELNYDVFIPLNHCG